MAENDIMTEEQANHADHEELYKLEEWLTKEWTAAVRQGVIGDVAADKLARFILVLEMLHTLVDKPDMWPQAITKWRMVRARIKERTGT